MRLKKYWRLKDRVYKYIISRIRIRYIRLKKILIYRPFFIIKVCIFNRNFTKNKKFCKKVNFYANNFPSFFRIIDAHNKEPMTQRWIGDMNSDETFWDIGANVGIFSLLAADLGLNVVAVEPLFQNNFNLYKTIEIDKNLSERIIILPICLASYDFVNKLYLPKSYAGYSGVQFNNNLTKSNNFFKNKNYKNNLSIWMMGFSGEKLLSYLPKKFSLPNHIKIDVDGNEKEILIGLDKVLSQKNLKSVLIETISEDDARATKKIMEKYNFRNELNDRESTVLHDYQCKCKNYIFRRI